MSTTEQIEKDKELYIKYMLENKDIESALKRWKRKRSDADLMMEVLKSVASRDKKQGALSCLLKIIPF